MTETVLTLPIALEHLFVGLGGHAPQPWPPRSSQPPTTGAAGKSARAGAKGAEPRGRGRPPETWPCCSGAPLCTGTSGGTAPPRAPRYAPCARRSAGSGTIDLCVGSRTPPTNPPSGLRWGQRSIKDHQQPFRQASNTLARSSLRMNNPTTTTTERWQLWERASPEQGAQRTQPRAGRLLV